MVCVSGCCCNCLSEGFTRMWHMDMADSCLLYRFHRRVDSIPIRLRLGLFLLPLSSTRHPHFLSIFSSRPSIHHTFQVYPNISERIGADIAGMAYIMTSSPTFWLTFLQVPIFTLLPDLILKGWVLTTLHFVSSNHTSRGGHRSMSMKSWSLCRESLVYIVTSWTILQLPEDGFGSSL